MARKVTYKSIQRMTKTQVGITQVQIHTFAKEFGTILSTADLGEIQRSSGMNFVAFTLSGEELGEYETRSKAGEALKKVRDTMREVLATGGAPKTESIEEAARRICPDAKNPVAALRKRISRGKIATLVVDGETRVVTL